MSVYSFPQMINQRLLTKEVGLGPHQEKQNFRAILRDHILTTTSSGRGRSQAILEQEFPSLTRWQGCELLCC